MSFFLAPGVHAVQVHDDIVFLDTLADAYFCLGGAADLLALGPGGQVEVTRQAPAVQLVEAGLLSRADPGPRSTPIAPTVSARQVAPDPARAQASARLRAPRSAMIAALGVSWTVSRRFSRASFSQLLSGPPAALGAHDEPTPALLEAVRQFERLRPWLPLPGECLLRSYHLRAFLRARGLDALWVFGVRTWPFAAHCWLQAGVTALDDDLERLVAYQPILAV